MFYSVLVENIEYSVRLVIAGQEFVRRVEIVE